MTPDHAKASRDLLAFYLEAGVDASVGEAANDYLSSPAPAAVETVRTPAPAPQPRPAAPAASQVPLVPEAAVMTAREAARSAASLDELRTILDRFDGCAL